MQSDPYRALLLAFGHPVVEEYLARKVRAAQISSIARLTPLTIIAGVVNAVVLTPVFGCRSCHCRLCHELACDAWLIPAHDDDPQVVSRLKRSPIAELASQRAYAKRAVTHATLSQRCLGSRAHCCLRER